MNLHNLPPGQSLFTLYVGQYGEPLDQVEEVDVVVARNSDRNLAAVVMEQAQEALARDYGAAAEVRFIADQSNGDTLFDCRIGYHIPLPVVFSPRLAETYEHPYDALLDLALDDPDHEYRDFLMER